jgi:CRP/FNR family transcriptional regulator
MFDSSWLSKVDVFFQDFVVSCYHKKELISHAHDLSSSVFYIKTGYVRVYRISEQGEELTLTILKPKDFFPLHYGIATVSSQYYLEAITPLEVWKAPQERFLTFIKTNPEIFFEITAQILVRFDGVLSRMECLVFSCARVKVAAMLLACAKRFGLEQGSDRVIQVPLTHHDIATLVGITRETTSLEMKKLEKEGFVSRMGKLVVIRNYTKLEQEILAVSQDTSLLNYSV